MNVIILQLVPAKSILCIAVDLYAPLLKQFVDYLIPNLIFLEHCVFSLRFLLRLGT